MSVVFKICEGGPTGCFLHLTANLTGSSTVLCENTFFPTSLATVTLSPPNISISDEAIKGNVAYVSWKRTNSLNSRLFCTEISVILSWMGRGRHIKLAAQVFCELLHVQLSCSHISWSTWSIVFSQIQGCCSFCLSVHQSGWLLQVCACATQWFCNLYDIHWWRWLYSHRNVWIFCEKLGLVRTNWSW